MPATGQSAVARAAPHTAVTSCFRPWRKPADPFCWRLPWPRRPTAVVPSAQTVDSQGLPDRASFAEQIGVTYVFFTLQPPKQWTEILHIHLFCAERHVTATPTRFGNDFASTGPEPRMPKTRVRDVAHGTGFRFRLACDGPNLAGGGVLGSLGRTKSVPSSSTQVRPRPSNRHCKADANVMPLRFEVTGSLA